MPAGMFEMRRDSITGWWVATVVDRAFLRDRFTLAAEPIDAGKKVIESRRGNTSHNFNPWFAVDFAGQADEEHGRVWFGELGWSGNWRFTVEQTSARQVRVTAVSLPDLMKRKVQALLARREIRDVFDIEHMLKRGVPVDEPPERARAMLAVIEALKRTDYTVKLGSLIEPGIRRYYATENFKLLAGTLRALTAGGRRAAGKL